MGDAAEHDGDLHAHMPAIDAEALGDLRGELAGRRQDERAATLAQRRLTVSGKPMHDRQREGRGLAGAGLGDAKQVAAGHHVRDCLGLDRGWSGVAFAFKGFEEGRVEIEFSKFRQLWILSWYHARGRIGTNEPLSGRSL